MTAARAMPPRQGQAGLGSSALGSLLPLTSFLLATVIADRYVDRTSTSLGSLAVAVPVYAGFIALPSMLPLAAARARLIWLAVLVVMTGVAGLAGVLVVTTDDGQSGLAVLWVPFVAIPLAGVLWIGQAVAARHAIARHPTDGQKPDLAGISERLAALVVDVVILVAVLVVPLTAMSRAGQEVTAGIVGAATATAYLAVLVAVRGSTIGQALLGLAVADAATGTRLSLSRALVRSLVVVLEVGAASTIILSPPAFAEVISAGTTGRSLTDRALGTTVARCAASRRDPVSS